MPLRLLLALMAAPFPVHEPAAMDQVEPSVALARDGAVVVWVARRAGAAEVLAAHTDDLERFSLPASISGPSGTTETIRPHVTARGDRAVAVWSDASRGDHDVWAALSEDGGRSFAPPVLAAGGPGGQVDPRAAIADDGTIVCAFSDGFGSTGADGGVVRRIRAIRSRDGASWSVPTAIDGEAGIAFAPDLAGSSTIAAVWRDARGGIYTARSIDRGTSFSRAQRIDPAGLIVTGRPRIAVEDGTVAVALDSRESGDGELDVRVMTSTGARFSQPVLRGASRALNQHQVSLASPTHAAWLDHFEPGKRRIVADDVVLSNAPDREVRHPAMVSDGARAIVVWEEEEGGWFAIRAAHVP